MPTSIHILTDEEFTARIASIETALNAACREGEWTAPDGVRLVYRFFPAENARATVVLVHGLSEFIEKFYELSWYLNQQGFHVLVFDQRGHGRSDRLLADSDVIHVERFDDYAGDLDGIIREVAVTLSDGLPLYLLAHSMGGTVACLYLAAHPDTPVKKAVLSAPLIVPHLKTMPIWLARIGTKYEWRKAGSGAAVSALSKPFNPNALFENSPDSSRARFDHNLHLRCSHKRYQTVRKSIGWNREALYIGKRLLNRSFLAPIQTPILLLSAGQDTVVKTHPHHMFAARCPHCRLHIIDNAKHCLFTGNAAVYEEFLTQTLNFFRGSD